MHHSKRHAGDLPNLVADSSGQAYYRAEVTWLKLDGSARGIVGRSVIVHADADDYQSQPAGNSGRRVACALVLLAGLDQVHDRNAAGDGRVRQQARAERGVGRRIGKRLDLEFEVRP